MDKEITNKEKKVILDILNDVPPRLNPIVSFQDFMDKKKAKEKDKDELQEQD